MGVTGAPVRFELERFEVIDDRLEVAGRWFGVRGIRFVRPSLLLRSPDGERPLLALLEHKPWAALDGAPWLAAFPWRGGEADPSRARLAVAQSIVVPLVRRGAAERAPDPLEVAQERLAVEEQRGARLETEVAWLREQLERALADREDAAGERDVATRELEDVRGALERARAERDAARAQADQAGGELETARAERDDAKAQFGTVVAELEKARGELEKALREHDEAVERNEGAAREREAAEQQRAAAVEERDAAARERAIAVRERKALVHEREAAIRERDAAREQAAALARDLENARRDLASARQLAGGRQPAAMRRNVHVLGREGAVPAEPGDAPGAEGARKADATQPLDAGATQPSDTRQAADPDATQPLDAGATQPPDTRQAADPHATQRLEPLEAGDAGATQRLDPLDARDAGATQPLDAVEGGDADAATQRVPAAPKPRRKVVITDPAVADRTSRTPAEGGPPTAAADRRQVSARIVAAIALAVFAIVVALILLTAV